MIYIKYGRIPDQDCITDDDCDEGDYDASVEIVETQAGYYYVLVDSDDPFNEMDYTINALGSHCSGLDVEVILNLDPPEYTTGDTLIVQARLINNDAYQYTTEIKAYFQTPVPKFKSIFNPHLTTSVPPGSDNTYTIFNYTFKGTEPEGVYHVEMKLIDPKTAHYYTRDIDTFNFTK